MANALQGCLIGASLIVDGARVHLAAQGQDIPEHLLSSVKLGVCCIGFAWQYKSLDSGQLPGKIAHRKRERGGGGRVGHGGERGRQREGARERVPPQISACGTS